MLPFKWWMMQKGANTLCRLTNGVQACPNLQSDLYWELYIWRFLAEWKFWHSLVGPVIHVSIGFSVYVWSFVMNPGTQIFLINPGSFSRTLKPRNKVTFSGTHKAFQRLGSFSEIQEPSQGTQKCNYLRKFYRNSELFTMNSGTFFRNFSEMQKPFQKHSVLFRNPGTFFQEYRNFLQEYSLSSGTKEPFKDL